MIQVLRNWLRVIVINIRYYLYIYLYEMHVAKSARISFGTKLDKTNPKDIHVGEESYIA